MKIAMVSPLWGPAYPTGSGVYAYELSKRMAALGHEVHVFTSQLGNFPPIDLPPNLHLRVLRTYGVMWDMNPIANVFPKLLREDFDVVHVHSYIFYMSNNAAAARAFRDFKYVLNFHGGVSHNGVPDSCYWKMWFKDHIFDRTIGQATVGLADKVVSISKADVPVINRMFGVEAEHVPNAVSTERFNPEVNGSRTITYVGKLERWKGVEDLIKIFRAVSRELKDVQFQVVGQGSLALKLQRAGLPLIMTGHVPHHAMPDLYHRSALSILPSFMEGAPTTCMESLSCEVPCVATAVGDTPDIIQDGHSGYLFKPGDIDESASCIVELMENDALRRRMGAKGRQHIIQNYSYDAVVRRMLDVYQRMD